MTFHFFIFFSNDSGPSAEAHVDAWSLISFACCSDLSKAFRWFLIMTECFLSGFCDFHVSWCLELSNLNSVIAIDLRTKLDNMALNMVNMFLASTLIFSSFFFDDIVFTGIYIDNRPITRKTIMYSLSLVLGFLRRWEIMSNIWNKIIFEADIFYSFQTIPFCRVSDIKIKQILDMFCKSKFALAILS